MERLHHNQRSVSELRIVAKNGDIRWVRVYANPVWDEKAQRLAGINGAVQDITERKLAEEALRERVNSATVGSAASSRIMRMRIASIRTGLTSWTG